MRRSAIVSLVLAVAVTACGGASFSDEVVAVEAAWLCDVPRFAYDGVGDIDAELSVRLDKAGVDLETYDEFKAHLDDSPELRARVATSFDAVCREG